MMSYLRPAVNRQPLFPRGGPEELAQTTFFETTNISISHTLLVGACEDPYDTFTRKTWTAIVVPALKPRYIACFANFDPNANA